ncbi:MAG: iron-only hydrogenase system regulator [Clostridiales bacterium]|nr:iron-only hydrogenase system regulator [Clostridiales bacterium]
MAKIAVIGAVLENPGKSRQIFNDIVSEYKEIIRGRMGLPMNDKGIAVISITVLGELDAVNSFVGKLGKIEGVTVKAAFSKNEY